MDYLKQKGIPEFIDRLNRQKGEFTSFKLMSSEVGLIKYSANGPYYSRILLQFNTSMTNTKVISIYFDIEKDQETFDQFTFDTYNEDVDQTFSNLVEKMIDISLSLDNAYSSQRYLYMLLEDIFGQQVSFKFMNREAVNRNKLYLVFTVGLDEIYITVWQVPNRRKTYTIEYDEMAFGTTINPEELFLEIKQEIDRKLVTDEKNPLDQTNTKLFQNLANKLNNKGSVSKKDLQFFFKKYKEIS